MENLLEIYAIGITIVVFAAAASMWIMRHKHADEQMATLKELSEAIGDITTYAEKASDALTVASEITLSLDNIATLIETDAEGWPEPYNSQAADWRLAMLAAGAQSG